ncbi:MAG: sensor histidine kinase [Betaproteobacteria bacterium]|nr:MAG: sensor histidine kinase [Betaproteobacteria bacterium]
MAATPLTDPRVRTEVVALLYGNAAVGVVMNLISVPLVWLAYRHVLPPFPLLPALALWVAIQGLSAWNRRQWQQLSAAQQRDPATSSRFLRRAGWMAWLLAAGIAALLAVLHFAAAPATPALAAAFALVYVLGACTSTLIYEPQVRVFSCGVLGSQALLLAHGGAIIEWLLAGLMVGLIVGLMAYARRYSAQLQQVIVLRFEVQDLLAEQAQLKDAAEAANQAKSRFFAAASHDVRQPLQAVMLTFHALRHARDEVRRNQLLDSTERNLGALRQLFDQVLDISRIDAGALPIKPQAVPLQPLFEKLDARLSNEAAAKQVWLRFAPTSAVVRSDPDALERILANLVGNAIKHTERGGVWIGLRGLRGRIEVRDSGIGIDAEHHEQIFEEFFQVNNPGRDRASGLGLGLSIVKRLCDLLQHPIGLRSASGRGSMFWIGVSSEAASTPRGDTDSALSEVAHAAMLDPAPLLDRHVYLIENDAQVALALGELLRGAGAKVSSFASASAALAAAGAFTGATDETAAADLVITDYRLGEAIDGASLLLKLRAIWARETCAIVLTGDTASNSLARIDAELGTSETHQRTKLMHKPVTADQLISAASELLSKQALC